MGEYSTQCHKHQRETGELNAICNERELWLVLHFAKSETVVLDPCTRPQMAGGEATELKI